MGKEKIVITGSNGIIGTVLTKGLKNEFDITGADLPQVDVCDYNQLLGVARGQTALIHLAWNTLDENLNTKTYLQENTQMFINAYKAALEAKIPRIIMASSVEVSDWRNTKGEILPSDTPNPVNIYGRHKVDMETVGRYYSKKGLEVVCVRFGGIAPSDVVNSIVSLRHRDCVNLIRDILKADSVPGNFEIVQAVSEVPGRIHSTENSF